MNKARLIEKIAELVKDKKIEGITELRDESDKDGMRVVIELRRGEVAEVLLNNLYQQTQMQSVFGINMVALVDGQPRLLNLKQILSAFIDHRRTVVTRRTAFELRKARDRAHILEGLAVALANIDPIIALIKAAANPADAKRGLVESVWEPGVVLTMLERAGAQASRPDGLSGEFGLTDAGYKLSETQAQSILDLRLQKLTGLEQEKIIDEYKQLLEQIRDLLEILADSGRLMQVIREELQEVNVQFGDKRRTEIIQNEIDLNIIDLITEEDVVVTLSHEGYAKSQPLTDYRAQRRGGRGKSATAMKDEDFVDKLFIASTHDTILCFSNFGKVYWKKVYELPQASRTARGKPIVNLLPLEAGERINAILPIREYEENKFIFFATADGTVKKTSLKDFSRPRSNGIIAIELRDGNELVGVDITDGERDVLLFTTAGKVIRFNEKNVRPMGRSAAGVRGIKVQPGQKVVSLIIADEGCVLTATANGYGKRTEIDQYPLHGRGGQGVVSIQVSERNGDVIAATLVKDEHEIMLISDGGTLVRIRVKEISTMGRNTQGVKLIGLSNEEKLVGVERIEESDEGEEEGEEPSATSSEEPSAITDEEPSAGQDKEPSAGEGEEPSDTSE